MRTRLSFFFFQVKLPAVHTTRRQRWTEVLFFVLLFGVIFFTSRQRLFLDPGTFWHTRTGELLLKRGFFDKDPYSYTYKEQPWIPSQWLAEVGMALIHKVQGLDGLMWAALLLLSGLFAWMGGRFVRAGCHPLLAALFVALVFLASCYHFHTRPHLLTLALHSLLVAFLIEVEAGRQPLSRLWWVLPFFALWTNLHGGVLAGLGTFGLCGFGWGCLFLLKQPSPLTSWKQVGLLLLIGLLSGLTIFINPYGWRLPEMWWIIMKADLPQVILEHRPLDPTDEVGMAILLMAAVYLFFLAGLKVRPRVTWLLPLIWLLLAWTRIRNGPLFAFTAALAIAEMLPHTRWMQWLARRSDMFVLPGVAGEAKPVGGFYRLPLWVWLLPLPFLLTMLLGTHGRANPRQQPVAMLQERLDKRHWPLELLEPLRREARRPNVRFFHDDLFGGFLIYFVPEIPVFLDDRCELFAQPTPQRPEPLLLDFARGRFHEPERFDRWMKEFHFTHLLLRIGKPEERALLEYIETLPEWELLQETDAAILFRRKGLPRPGR